jgi:hypothetical protein
MGDMKVHEEGLFEARAVSSLDLAAAAALSPA